jgi:hypothetical protein
MDIKPDIIAAVGHTPLVRLNKVVPPGAATVLAKCEFMNPCGSIKDRMACYILEKAEREGLIRPGATLVENTSGNTGLGVAMFAAVRGYRAVFTMPDKMSLEKVNMLKAFGAEVIITPTDVPGDSPDHYVNVAKRVAEERRGFYLNQYHNPVNIEAHSKTHGPGDLGPDRRQGRRRRRRRRHGRHHLGHRAILQEHRRPHPHRRRRHSGQRALPLLPHRHAAHAVRLQGRGHRRRHQVRRLRSLVHR